MDDNPALYLLRGHRLRQRLPGRLHLSNTGRTKSTSPTCSTYIHPEECIDCGACEPECPWQAIFEEPAVPDVFKDDDLRAYSAAIPISSRYGSHVLHRRLWTTDAESSKSPRAFYT